MPTSHSRCLHGKKSCGTALLTMKSAVRRLLVGNVSLVCAFLTGCVTEPAGIQTSKAAMAQSIASEPVGDYFIGRRYFKPDYKFWGYVRKPGQPWSTAQ